MDELVNFNILIGTLVGLIAMYPLDKKRRTESPNTLPYRWGYFVGVSTVSFAPSALVLALPLFQAGGWLAAIGFGIIVLVICGGGILARQRWAWVVGTMLMLNPIAWIINGIYAKNRWAEFGLEARRQDRFFN